MTLRSASFHHLLQAALATILSSSFALAQNPRAVQHFKAAPDLEAAADTASVIVQYNDDAQDGRRQDHARRHGLRQMQHSPFAHGHLRRAQIDELLNDQDVKYVSPNREVSLAHFPPWMLKEAIGYQFAAMAVPERPTQTGKGIGIAIIDSGVTVDDYFKDSTCASSRLVYRQNFVTGESSVDDAYGHGTHVAGILAGTGLCLPGANVDMSGIAREAKIISLRALNGRGQGTDSDVIAAIDRAIALKSTYNIRVINLSLGRVIKESFKLDPLCQAVEKAWKSGIVVVVAAGNNGRDNTMGTQGYSTITSPGNDPFVITVGATRMLGNTGREDDAVSSYSSKGPALLDQIVKPDLVAPGNIVYARMSDRKSVV